MEKRMPLWKWFILLIASLVLGFIGYAFLQTLAAQVNNPYLTAAGSIALLLLYWAGVWLIERVPAHDLRIGKLLPHTFSGFLIGAAFIAIVVGLIAAAGCAHVTPNDGFSWKEQAGQLILFLSVGVGEEMVFRGILFRWIDRRWGFAAALTVSALFFGIMHIAQPGASLWSSIAIAIEAGLLLGAAYKWSGTLWMPIGIHWAWNYFQGNVFGIAVSGIDSLPSFLKTQMTGPELITGGAFGAEASIITVLLGAAVSAVFICLYWRRSRKSQSE